MPVYNKLVRDRIPQVIEQSGKKYTTKILSDKEYITELQRKTEEELNEYLNADNDEKALEELADLLELIHTLSVVHGGSIEEVEEIRKRKAGERGRFNNKVYLVEVEDE